MADYLQSRGKYMVLDLHEYRAAKPHHAAFWLNAATRYKDHPGVIFGLLNEPHDITWEIWRNVGRTRQTRLGRRTLRAWTDALAARQDFWNRSHFRRAMKHRAIAAARTAIQMPKTGRQPLKRSWRAAKP